jgi:hypothetical protein
MGVYHGMDGQSRNTCALENVCALLETKRFYAMIAALPMRSYYLPMFHAWATRRQHCNLGVTGLSFCMFYQRGRR